MRQLFADILRHRITYNGSEVIKHWLSHSALIKLLGQVFYKFAIRIPYKLGKGIFGQVSILQAISCAQNSVYVKHSFRELFKLIDITLIIIIQFECKKRAIIKFIYVIQVGIKPVLYTIG